MLALTVALLTAALAVGSKILSDHWTLHQQTRGVAAALAGEIGAYLQLLNLPTTVPAYRTIAALHGDDRRKCLRLIFKPPIGHPVFDKIADKLGLLPIAEARDVSQIYNVVTGMRIFLAGFSSKEFLEADDEYQVGFINHVADEIEKYHPIAEALIVRLTKVSDRKFRCYLFC